MKERKNKENELDEKIERITKAIEKIKRISKILKEIENNEDGYKILLMRKESGESVEDLITKNRKYREILEEKHKEVNKWLRSEEAKPLFKLFEEEWRKNPDLNEDMRYYIGRDIVSFISDEMEKNEEEYQKLLERRNNGEYVDDLINQNLYRAKLLIEKKKNFRDEWDGN